ncbi:unnamed protein product [Diatraea saccharalis]|uniref:Uncharacterized protein n=1 Tax=Diatraea saccharalis TaxID=40085 RepID=A0A9N9R754_9NEOP|nr:unnamed protein product [Diatraea saccharalis]
MAYLGKEFTVEKDENYAEFIKSLGLPEAEAAHFIAYKPVTKLEKNGDTYKITTVTSNGTRVAEFKSGVEFDEELKPGFTVRTKYVVNGDTITQDMTKDGKSTTYKREFSPDKMKLTITSSFWDGVAYRYYKLV